MRRERLLVVAVGCMLAVAPVGCGGGGSDSASTTTVAGSGGTPAFGQAITAADVEEMSVRLTDLPPGYERIDKGSGQTNAQECLAQFESDNAGVAAQMASLGLESCYAVNFKKEEGGRSTDVSSGGVVFPDADAAAQGMVALRAGLTESASATGAADARGSQEIPVTGLGDEATPGFRYTVDLLGQRAAIIVYVWRDGNAVGFYGGSDALGDMNEQSILEVAKMLSSRAPG